MEQAEQNNPAGRLHAILSRAKEGVGTSGYVRTINLWIEVFDIEIPEADVLAPELEETVSRLLQLNKLINETEARLRNIEGLPDRYFRPFERIRDIPRKSLAALDSDIGGTIRAVTETDMTILEFCSERLGEQHAEPIVDEGELTSILENVDILFNEVQQSDLDPELKTFVLDGLESIRRGIFEFRIRGPQRLKETLAEIVGTLTVNHDVIRAARDQDQSIVERFEKAFYRLAAAVSFAVDGPALLSAVNKLLPGGG